MPIVLLLIVTGRMSRSSILTSLFQSLPDVGVSTSYFPVLPIEGLDKPLDRRAVLLDIAAQMVLYYVDSDGVETTMPMPAEYLNDRLLYGRVIRNFEQYAPYLVIRQRLTLLMRKVIGRAK